MVVQLALAVHAYHHGRISPWVWIILFFPIAGSLLYAIIFIGPTLAAPRRRASRADLTLKPVARGPFARKNAGRAPGARPTTAIPIPSVATIDAYVRDQDCPECEAPLAVKRRTPETIDGERIQVVLTHCKFCPATPTRYFKIETNPYVIDADDGEEA
ncbi:MAG: hypothetical protein AAGF12_16930 [Myxococcota bacterium]